MQEILLNEGLKAIKEDNKQRVSDVIYCIVVIHKCFVYHRGMKVDGWLPIVNDVNLHWKEIKTFLHIE